MRHVWVLLLVAGTAGTGCDRNNERAESAAADSAQAVENAAAVTELLSPLRAVSRAEVEYGQLAAQRAGAESIRQYGQTIAADHRALLGMLDQAAERRGATLSEEGAALEMANMIRMAHAGLENLSGPDFDLPFIRAEVESHRQLLDRLDQHAIPAATSEDVRNMLTDMRAMADAHLTRARQLLAQQLGETLESPPAAGTSQRPLGTPQPQQNPPPRPDGN